MVHTNLYRESVVWVMGVAWCREKAGIAKPAHYHVGSFLVSQQLGLEKAASRNEIRVILREHGWCFTCSLNIHILQALISFITRSNDCHCRFARLMAEYNSTQSKLKQRLATLESNITTPQMNTNTIIVTPSEVWENILISDAIMLAQ